jgi:hypothetical protein
MVQLLIDEGTSVVELATKLGETFENLRFQNTKLFSVLEKGSRFIDQLPVGDIVQFRDVLEQASINLESNIRRPLVNLAKSVQESSLDTLFNLNENASSITSTIDEYTAIAKERFEELNGVVDSIQSDSLSELNQLQEESGLLIPWELAQF